MTTDKSRALDSKWLASQPRDQQAGLLLGAYHERAGLRQNWLAEQIGASTQSLYQWESGKVKLPEHKAGQLVPHLKLTAKQAKRFILLSDPAITQHVGEAWLDKQIEHKNWQAISYPAFDTQWLDAQPERYRASLMLRHGRQRLSMSQQMLGALLDVTREMENHWELGGHVPANKTGSIIKHLNFSEAEAQRFIQEAAPKVAAHSSSEWLNDKVHAVDAASLDFPALNENWLDAQPAHMRGALLLRAYREREHLQLQDLATATGTTKSAVHKWETPDDATGDITIPAYKVGTLAGALCLSDEEAKRFITTARPELLKTVSDPWLQDKIGQKKWQHIDHPALDAEWLGKQAPLKKAGLLLKAYRERKGMTQEALALVTANSRDHIGDMERGSSPIRQKRIEKLAAALGLTPEERTCLTDVAQESLEARRMLHTKTSLGASMFDSKVRNLSTVETPSRRR